MEVVETFTAGRYLFTIRRLDFGDGPQYRVTGRMWNRRTAAFERSTFGTEARGPGNLLPNCRRTVALARRAAERFAAR